MWLPNLDNSLRRALLTLGMIHRSPKLSWLFLLLGDYSPGRGIWRGVGECCEIGGGFRNVISNFAWFWQLLSMFNFWKGDWVLGSVSTHIWHFSNTSQFLKSFGNSCTWLVMLDIKYRFTCGDSELS